MDLSCESASENGAGKPALSPTIVFSTLLSFVVLALAGLLFADSPRRWDEQRSIIKGLAAVDVGYVGALFASAVAYAWLGKKWIGSTHAALMAGLSVYCIVQGLSTLNDKTIMGGRGPDANPAAGVSYAIAIGVVMLGVVCGIFAVVVWLKLLRSSSGKTAQ
jgi:hypothetical protein